MIVYVNGDSNSAAAEAVNSFGFAEDDPLYWALGRRPHPDNERVSYGCQLANMLNAILICDAESASSNDRIIRITRDYLNENNKPDLVVIGWSTWEREEWLYEGTYWQVNAGGVGHDWPDEIKDRYRDYILNIDMDASVSQAHDKIWALHNDLQKQNINHVFFNCFESFGNLSKLDWDSSYVEPYNKDFTFYNWLTQKGFKTVYPGSYHFGPDAHDAWAKFLYQRLTIK